MRLSALALKNFQKNPLSYKVQSHIRLDFVYFHKYLHCYYLQLYLGGILIYHLNTYLMRLANLITLLLLLASPREMFSQYAPAEPMVFGKIPPEQLQMKTFDPDTTADAVVLCNYGQANIENPPGSIRLRWEHQKRIKILKKAGFSYANIQIPFYSYNKAEEFFFDKATIYLPSGEVVKLTKKDVFIEKLSDKHSVAKLVFPKLEEGCVIEYSYFINSESIHELREWYFQEDIPVLWSEIRVDFPEFLHYIFLFQGNKGMEKTEDKDGIAHYESNHGSFIISPRRYAMQNAPALKEEAYITTMSDYLARIRFQLDEVHQPDGRVEKVLTDWNNMQRELEYASVFGEQFLKKGNHKKMVEEIMPMVANLPTNLEKAKFLYHYLNTSIEWNGNYSAATSLKKLDEIYDHRKANSCELNMMMYVLLREAGIPAFPVLTSTRTHGQVYEQYPILDQFNHMMLVSVIDGNQLFLDLSDPLRPMGYPKVNALNDKGLMLKIGEGNPLWIDIVPPKDGIDILLYQVKLDEEGTLTGSIVGAHKGYNAIPEREDFIKDSTGMHWKERLAKRFPDAEIKSVHVGNLKELDKTFTDTIQVSIPNAAQVAGDFMYLPPTLWSSFSENFFKMKQRNYPVDIPYPFQEQFIMKLKIPDGYAIESLPSTVNKSLPGNGGSFTFATNINDRQVQISARFNITKLQYAPEEYPALKELFDQVITKYGEQIVLKKV